MRSTLSVLSRPSVPIDEDAREQTYVTTGVPTSSVSSMDMVSAGIMLNVFEIDDQKDKLNLLLHSNQRVGIGWGGLGWKYEMCSCLVGLGMHQPTDYTKSSQEPASYVKLIELNKYISEVSATSPFSYMC